MGCAEGPESMCVYGMDGHSGEERPEWGCNQTLGGVKWKQKDIYNENLRRMNPEFSSSQ